MSICSPYDFIHSAFCFMGFTDYCKIDSSAAPAAAPAPELDDASIIKSKIVEDFILRYKGSFYLRFDLFRYLLDSKNMLSLGTLDFRESYLLKKCTLNDGLLKDTECILIKEIINSERLSETESKLSAELMSLLIHDFTTNEEFYSFQKDYKWVIPPHVLYEFEVSPD